MPAATVVRASTRTPRWMLEVEAHGPRGRRHPGGAQDATGEHEGEERDAHHDRVKGRISRPRPYVGEPVDDLLEEERLAGGSGGDGEGEPESQGDASRVG